MRGGQILDPLTHLADLLSRSHDELGALGVGSRPDCWRPSYKRRLDNGQLTSRVASCDDRGHGVRAGIGRAGRPVRPPGYGRSRIPCRAVRAARGLGPRDRSVGPPGSGKTVLLRSWISQAAGAECAAWVPVERGEWDPQRFWLSVLGALRRTGPGSALVGELTAGARLGRRLRRDARRLRLQTAQGMCSSGLCFSLGVEPQGRCGG